MSTLLTAALIAIAILGSLYAWACLLHTCACWQDKRRARQTLTATSIRREENGASRRSHSA